MDQREVEHLIIEAKGRIDTATAELLLAIKGANDATISQTVALKELTAARKAFKALRTKLKPRVTTSR